MTGQQRQSPGLASHSLLEKPRYFLVCGHIAFRLRLIAPYLCSFALSKELVLKIQRVCYLFSIHLVTYLYVCKQICSVFLEDIWSLTCMT